MHKMVMRFVMQDDGHVFRGALNCRELKDVTAMGIIGTKVAERDRFKQSWN